MLINDNSNHSQQLTANLGKAEDIYDPQTFELVHPAIAATLEACMCVLSSNTSNKSQPLQAKPVEASLDCIRLVVEHRYLSGRAGGGHQQDSASLLHRVLESVSKCSESNQELVQTALLGTLTSIITCPKCAVHENSLLLALRSTFHVYLVTKSSSCKTFSKKALVDMLQAVFLRMEAHEAILQANSSSASSLDAKPIKTIQEDSNDDKAVASQQKNNQQSQQQQQQQQQQPFSSQYHADAYYLFRSLCKLSSKELPADTVDESAITSARSLFNSVIPTDPTELHSKILSLELIWTVLTSPGFGGTAVGTSEKFVYLVQHYLCVPLLKNCVSNHTQVAFWSQKIFLVLVRAGFYFCFEIVHI